MRSKELDKYRLHHPYFGVIPDNGFDGYYQMMMNAVPIQILASSGYGWEHVSVSILGGMLPPSWNIMCKVKDLFWGKEVWVCQFHPPEAEYVNNHPGCLHLWRPLEATLPTPPSVLVGIKSLGNLHEHGNHT